MTDLTSEAKALLNNAAYRDAVERAQQAYLNAAMNCPLNDDEGRRLHLSAARIVGQIASHITALATDKGENIVDLPDFYAERARARWATLADLKP